jgi:hypothetical protein
MKEGGERVTFWHRDTGVAPTVTFSHAGDGFVYQVNESGPWFGAEDADVRHALIAWMVAAGQR